MANGPLSDRSVIDCATLIVGPGQTGPDHERPGYGTHVDRPV